MNLEQQRKVFSHIRFELQSWSVLSGALDSLMVSPCQQGVTLSLSFDASFIICSYMLLTVSQLLITTDLRQVFVYVGSQTL
jgi:hypothetical protein